MRTVLLGTLSLTMLLACGSYPKPEDAYSAAQKDIGRAEAGGAPAAGGDAKLYWTQASEHLAKSKALMDQGENQSAEDYIMVARAEAQLALSLAKQQQAEDQARKAQEELSKAKGGQ